jgi:uncharacterized SAM-binding protein YcdF (DUF218 family)
MDFAREATEVAKVILLPPMSLFLAFACGLLLQRRHARLGRRVCIGAIGLLYFLSTGVGSWLLAHPLESLEPALTLPAPGAQAIVVLSAGKISSSPEYGTAVPDFIALERISYGAHVYRRQALPILVSGGLIGRQPGDEALALGMKRVYQNEFRIPVQWTEERSRNTAENAYYSAQILKRAGIVHVILVTDALHMRRARLAFEREGIKVSSGPTFYHEPGRFRPFRLLPTAENLRRSYYALYEWLGLAWTVLFAG